MSNAAIIDTLYLVPSDTLSISKPDTLVAALQQVHRTPADWAIAIIPSVLIVLGWLVAFLLQWWLQRKQFRAGLLNEARQRVVRDLRDYSEWYSRMFDEVKYLSQEISVTYSENARKLAIEDHPERWSRSLEEYDQLLPEVQGVAREMMASQRRMTWEISYYFDASKPRIPNDELVQKAKYWLQWIIYQGGLVQDLLVYVQRSTLSAVLDRKIPELEPGDPNRYPRLVMKGDVLVVDPGNTGYESGKAHDDLRRRQS